MTGSPSPRPVAVYTDLVDLDPTTGVDLLTEAGFEVRVLDTADPSEIVRRALDANALLIGYSPVTSALIAELPRLRIIATQSAGVDMVDLPAAARHGVWVANLPDAATEQVAAHTAAMALALVRGLPFLDRAVRAGIWDGPAHSPRLSGSLTFGVLGFGRIGRRVANLAAPHFRQVLAHDPIAPSSTPSGVTLCDLNELLERCDVLSLHLPLTERTRLLVDDDLLVRMRPGAILINVSRGELIDHDALVRALDEGRLSAAGLDVLPVEPPDPAAPLLQHPRIMFTPHVAYLSPESAEAYVRGQAENVVAWWRTSRPLHAVLGPDQRS